MFPRNMIKYGGFWSFCLNIVILNQFTDKKRQRETSEYRGHIMRSLGNDHVPLQSSTFQKFDPCVSTINHISQQNTQNNTHSKHSGNAVAYEFL